MEVSQLICFSPKRSTLFKSLQTQLSPAAPSLKPLSPSRWTVQNATIQSLLDNYQVLCEELSQINREGRDEYAYKAGGMLSLMEKFGTFFGLMLFTYSLLAWSSFQLHYNTRT